MNNEVSQENAHHAAILLRGGRKDLNPGTVEFDQRETVATFDFWKYTQDFDEIMNTPAERLVVGESLEAVAELLQAQYPNPHGLSMLLYGRQDVPTKEDRHSGSRRRRYDTEYLTGWRVLTHPAVTHEDWKTEEELQTLSLEYGGVWIDSDSYSELGYEPGARNKGFVPRDTLSNSSSRDWTFIRYNPRNYQLKAWKVEKARIEELLKGAYPQGLLEHIGKAMAPVNWPRKHRFWAVLDASPDTELEGLLRLLKFSRFMVPCRAFWRKYSTGHTRQGNVTFRDTIDKLLIYTYGVVEHARKCLANKDGYGAGKRQARAALVFTKWIKEEARALKLKMPDRPVVPPKPENPFAVKHTRQKPLRVVEVPDLEFPVMPSRPENTESAQLIVAQ